jgi:Family of unknown function (DUF6152)
MRTVVVLAVGLGLAVASTASVAAHHAFAAEFDAQKPIRFEGVVTRVEWVNPHTWFFIRVTKPDGKTEDWAIEAGTPNVLFRRGFSKDALKAGTKISIEGYRAKDGSFRGNGRNLTTPDGKMLFMGSSGTGAPYDSGPAKPPR